MRTTARGNDSYEHIVDKLESFTYISLEKPGEPEGWYANIRLKHKNRDKSSCPVRCDPGKTVSKFDP